MRLMAASFAPHAVDHYNYCYRPLLLVVSRSYERRKQQIRGVGTVRNRNRRWLDALLRMLLESERKTPRSSRSTRDRYDVVPADLEAADAEVRLREDEWRRDGAIHVTESQVEQAKQQAVARQSEFAEASARCRPSFQLMYLRLVRLVALTRLHRHTGPTVVGVTGTILALLLLLPLLVLFSALGGIVKGALILGAVGVCLATAAVLFLWPTEEKRHAYHRVQQEWSDRKTRAETACAAMEHSRLEYQDRRQKWRLWDLLEKARKRRQGLAALLASVKYELFHTDWRALRGPAFECFLSRVFEALGYHVQLTKKTGDQGADLILTGKSTRIAVQTKGYAGSVGNGAVQEVVAAMAFYRCSSCGVVTNSYFTPAARQLAQANTCRLVDGSQIPDLIEGRIY
jgi:restriction system protein